jgi:hypothetical protein
MQVSIPVVARSKVVCGRSLAGIVGSNPAVFMDICLLTVFCVVRGLCDELFTCLEESCQLWCVVLWDCEALIRRRPWPTLDRSAKGGEIWFYIFLYSI